MSEVKAAGGSATRGVERSSGASRPSPAGQSNSNTTAPSAAASTRARDVVSFSAEAKEEPAATNSWLGGLSDWFGGDKEQPKEPLANPRNCRVEFDSTRSRVECFREREAAIDDFIDAEGRHPVVEGMKSRYEVETERLRAQAEAEAAAMSPEERAMREQDMSDRMERARNRARETGMPMDQAVIMEML